MEPIMRPHPVRRVLDTIYLLCGYAVAGFLLLMLLIIVAQMAIRWGGGVFIGATNYAGYCMAASSFLALAYALVNGAHIRVGLLLTHLGRFRRFGEIWCFSVASALSLWMTWYAWRGVQWSIKLHDISQGQDAMPLWIVQIPMVVGAGVLALSFVDHLIRILFFGLGGLDDKAASAEETI